MSHVIYFYFFGDKLVKLIGGGSVINGAYPGYPGLPGPTRATPSSFGISLDVFEFLRFGCFFPCFKKIAFSGILGPP